MRARGRSPNLDERAANIFTDGFRAVAAGDVTKEISATELFNQFRLNGPASIIVFDSLLH